MNRVEIKLEFRGGVKKKLEKRSTCSYEPETRGSWPHASSRHAPDFSSAWTITFRSRCSDARKRSCRTERVHRHHAETFFTKTEIFEISKTGHNRWEKSVRTSNWYVNSWKSRSKKKIVRTSSASCCGPNTKSRFWSKKNNLNFEAKIKIWGFSTSLNSNFGVPNRNSIGVGENDFDFDFVVKFGV